MTKLYLACGEHSETHWNIINLIAVYNCKTSMLISDR